MSQDEKSFSGRRRRMKTRWTVAVADVLSEFVITVGGIGTIVAVMAVFVVLVARVAPLGLPASISDEVTRETHWGSAKPVHLAVDEYRTIGWVLFDDGRLETFRVDNGEKLAETQLFADKQLSAISTSVGRGGVLLGFLDGTIQFASVDFKTSFIDVVDAPEEFQGMKPGERATFKPSDNETGVIELTSQGQYRLQLLTTNAMEPLQVSDKAILLLDHVPEPGGGGNAVSLSKEDRKYVAYSADGKLRYGIVAEEEDFLTGDVTLNNETIELDIADIQGERPNFLLQTARGNDVFLAWKSGQMVRLVRQNAEDGSGFVLSPVEKVDLLPDTDAELTVCDFILGRETVFVGDSDGGASGWFLVRTAETDDPQLQERKTGDGFTLVRVHELESAPGEKIVSMRASERSRMLAVGYESGRFRVYQMTTELLVLDRHLPGDVPVVSAMITPKDDGLLVESENGLSLWNFDPRHPEISIATAILPVWYEGYPQPRQIWQSSSAGVEPEMKLGLYPLISGTLKATFYSMLFGAPIALLAAIYTSEFTTYKVRTFVKPTVEMMASLPSVVLGFLAAIVFAPVVESFLPFFLTTIVAVPLTFITAAMLWQLMPRRIGLILEDWRLWFMVPVLFLGLFVSFQLAPWVDHLAFEGNVKSWLNGDGNGVVGWVMLMIPLGGLGAFFLNGMVINPYLRAHAVKWSRPQFALMSFAKFAALVLMTFLVAWGVSSLLYWAPTWFGALPWDPRGTFVDSYAQRNSFVVGFVMGFAVIPIIYTIADDALATVPKHLRSASLGCGATPWQTTVRVVIPTAMSGLFSALMIGLGRVVGETMIVLMAGGNTPVTDWNIFSGFRTLSATIAIELPEAVENSTHFRMLFAAALVLFVITFLINTAAEIVRLRFRKRAYQL
ncbi:ABC transporter permease subunit [Blastopirellula retiformator]|uniref:Phosphate transport system permease protein PstC n=1 Tax=Blastopirellula retiformator TaxID=2527970 RepID=A0A5C5VMC5_9BACT|nr:ABC transporter permease subunit [Blastopirellula retiformator]TWT39041.1 Phosphate transport system permease protein PstC [Blastopirellula retiformator]